MLVLVIVAASALLTATVGVPLAVRFSRPHLWSRRRLARDPRHVEPMRMPSFEPMELGLDPMQWPSENPWKSSSVAHVPWPSETWDDPHFGIQGPKSVQSDQPPTAKPERAQTGRSQSPRQVERMARQEMSGLRNKALELKRATKKKMRDAAMQRAQATQHMMEGKVSRTQHTVGREAAAPVHKAHDVSVHNVPKPAEVERLVGEHGLAGAVQEVMRQTGWDFQTAAQYLAKVRRNR